MPRWITCETSRKCFLMLLICSLLPFAVWLLYSTGQQTQRVTQNVLRPNNPYPEISRPAPVTSKNHSTNTKVFVVHFDEKLIIKAEVPPPLPTCPPDIKLNRDDLILEHLTFCADQKTLAFPPQLEAWRYKTNIFCDGKIALFAKEVALLYEVVVNKTLCAGIACEARNTSTVSSILKEPESPNLELGFFSVKCDDIEKAKQSMYIQDGEEVHLRTWKNSLTSINAAEVHVDRVSTSDLTIVVKRYEYLNLYHSMSDVYNAFLALKYLNISPRNADVLIIDEHPTGSLYSLWTSLFNSVEKLSPFPMVSYHRKMLWNRLGYDSELLIFSDPSLPYVEEFREFVLGGFNTSLTKLTNPANCTSLRILLLSRTDYNHRQISRKISNEDELLEAMTKQYPSFKIVKIRLEEFNLKEQFNQIAQTDILIGMHGAGLTHALFLPPHAAVIELLPDYFRLAYGHFEGISRWRKLKYKRWKGTADLDDVKTLTTVVPVPAILDILKEMVTYICS